jgi:hypothetical protein
LSDDSHASKVFFVEARVPFFRLEKVFETVPEQKKVLLLACQGSKIFGYSRSAKQVKRTKKGEPEKKWFCVLKRGHQRMFCAK